MKAAEEDRHLTVHTPADVDRYLNQIRKAASRTSNWVSQSRDPLERFRLMKFTLVGGHPIEDRPLNLMEQINPAPSAAVALEITRIFFMTAVGGATCQHFC